MSIILRAIFVIHAEVYVNLDCPIGLFLMGRFHGGLAVQSAINGITTRKDGPSVMIVSYTTLSKCFKVMIPAMPSA